LIDGPETESPDRNEPAGAMTGDAAASGRRLHGE